MYNFETGSKITLFLQRNPTGGNTCKVNGEEIFPDEGQKIVNHSPDGFEWGYLGSGPAQLSLSICLHLFGDVARYIYQRFKFSYIGKISQKPDLQTVTIDISAFEIDYLQGMAEKATWDQVEAEIALEMDDKLPV